MFRMVLAVDSACHVGRSSSTQLRLKSLYRKSLLSLCVLCVSAVNVGRVINKTAETQRTQRKRREGISRRISFMKSLFTKAIIQIVVITTSLVAVAAQSKDVPRVWEAPLNIPTYELNPPNPYPALLDWQRRKWRPVY